MDYKILSSGGSWSWVPGTTARERRYLTETDTKASTRLQVGEAGYTFEWIKVENSLFDSYVKEFNSRSMSEVCLWW